MEYTLVGGGIAAVSAARAIRELDPDGPITVVSEEEHCFYYRPMTPLVVKGDKERDEVLHDSSDLGHVHFVHDRAVGLDCAQREVRLASGKTMGFQKLLIATGSAPIVPGIEGIGGEHTFYLRTLADAEQLRRKAKDCRRAVVLGGGFVGVKTAVSLRASGLEVTIVELQEHIFAPKLDPEGASLIGKALAGNGIDILTGETLTAIADGGRTLTLRSGGKLTADMLCVAVGVRPNIGWLAGSGIATDRAILVNDRMETSEAGVYAAGDVTQVKDIVTGKDMVSLLWTHAVEMGKAAGVNMAGGKARHGGCLETMNATEILGIPLIAVGDVTARGAGLDIVSKRTAESYRKLVFQGDRLNGFLFIGDIANAGVYTALARSRAALGPLKRLAAERTLTYADFSARG